MTAGAHSIVGIDIGGTHIRIGMVDEHAALSGFQMDSSEILFTENPLQSLTAYIRDYCRKHTETSTPQAVAIGFPSILNKEKTMLLSTPNLPWIDHLDVVAPLRAALGIPVFIDRDVHMLLLHDMHAYQLQGKQIVIGCYFGTGIGNSICINGDFLSGQNGVAGELGHIPVLGEQMTCGCGNIGCMETIASGKTLQRIRARCFPDTPIDQLFSRHGNTDVLKQYIENIAMPIAAEINIFDPSCVVLGGGVIQMLDFPEERLRHCIYAHTRKPLPGERVSLIFTSSNPEAGVIGAGLYAHMQIQKGCSQ